MQAKEGSKRLVAQIHKWPHTAKMTFALFTSWRRISCSKNRIPCQNWKQRPLLIRPLPLQAPSIYGQWPCRGSVSRLILGLVTSLSRHLSLGSVYQVFYSKPIAHKRIDCCTAWLSRFEGETNLSLTTGWNQVKPIRSLVMQCAFHCIKCSFDKFPLRYNSPINCLNQPNHLKIKLNFESVHQNEYHRGHFIF